MFPAVRIKSINYTVKNAALHLHLGYVERTKAADKSQMPLCGITDEAGPRRPTGPLAIPTSALSGSICKESCQGSGQGNSVNASLQMQELSAHAY